MSVGFGRFCAAVGCKTKPTEKHKSVFRFRLLFRYGKPEKKVGFRFGKNDKNPTKKNDLRLSVHNPARACLSCETVQVPSAVTARFCVSCWTPRTRPKQGRARIGLRQTGNPRRYVKMVGRSKMAGNRLSLWPNGTALPPTWRAG